MLYFVIAVLLVGAEVVGLMRGWPRPSLRTGSAVLTTIILAGYLVKVFKRRLHATRFWIILVVLLAAHIAWALFVAPIIVMVALGPELVILGILIRKFVEGGRSRK